MLSFATVSVLMTVAFAGNFSFPVEWNGKEQLTFQFQSAHNESFSGVLCANCSFSCVCAQAANSFPAKVFVRGSGGENVASADVALCGKEVVLPQGVCGMFSVVAFVPLKLTKSFLVNLSVSEVEFSTSALGEVKWVDPIPGRFLFALQEFSICSYRLDPERAAVAATVSLSERCILLPRTMFATLRGLKVNLKDSAGYFSFKGRSKEEIRLWKDLCVEESADDVLYLGYSVLNSLSLVVNPKNARVGFGVGSSNATRPCFAGIPACNPTFQQFDVSTGLCVDLCGSYYFQRFNGVSGCEFSPSWLIMLGSTLLFLVAVEAVVTVFERAILKD